MRFKQLCNHPSQLLGDGRFAPERERQVRPAGRDLRGDRLAAGEGAGLHAVPRDDRAAGRLPGRRVRPAGPGAARGTTAVKRRKTLVDQFQRDDGPPFFVLSLKAGGTGLNLTAASHVIHFDRWWNPAVENQATDRAFRIGQQRNVLVHKFVCRGTIEETDRRPDRRETPTGGRPAGRRRRKMLTEMTDAELIRFVVSRRRTNHDVRINMARRAMDMAYGYGGYVHGRLGTLRPGGRAPPAGRERKWSRCARRASTSSRSQIEGRKIAKTFWGEAWCDHLESFSDYENRLPRGRTYVRNGSVCHLAIAKGKIEAKVSRVGTLRRRDLASRRLPPRNGQRSRRRCAGQIGSLLELLQGKLSDHVMEVVTDRQEGPVSPAWRDLAALQLPRLGDDVQARGRRALRRRRPAGQQARSCCSCCAAWTTRN